MATYSHSSNKQSTAITMCKDSTLNPKSFEIVNFLIKITSPKCYKRPKQILYNKIVNFVEVTS